MQKPLCVVVGVGPGNGTAFARRFAKEGYRVALLARSKTFTTQLAAELGDASAYECDVSQVDDVAQTFKQIETDLGAAEVVIYNAGSGNWGDFETIPPTVFENNWRVNTLGLFTVAQAVLPAMRKQQRGAIIIIGATASRRGGIKTAAFASAKAAQRSLAESLAKYTWSLGIHTALIIIDGVIDIPRTREKLADKPDDFFLQPDAIADTAYWLTQQQQSAWSFEVDVRPYKEKW